MEKEKILCKWVTQTRVAKRGSRPVGSLLLTHTTVHEPSMLTFPESLLETQNFRPRLTAAVSKYSFQQQSLGHFGLKDLFSCSRSLFWYGNMGLVLSSLLIFQGASSQLQEWSIMISRFGVYIAKCCLIFYKVASLLCQCCFLVTRACGCMKNLKHREKCLSKCNKYLGSR